LKTAKDIMTKNVKTASPDEQIKKVVSKMERYGIKEVPIVENGIFVGMVTYYDILDFVRADPEEKVSTLMIKPPIVSPDTPIGDVITLMVKTGVEAIPVLDGEKLVGLISDYDILKSLLNDRRIKGLKVRDVMEEEIKVLTEDESVSEARRWMRHNRWNMLPVVDEEGKLLGAITSLDILRTFYKKPKEKLGRKDRAGKAINPFSMPVKSLIIRDLPEVKPKDSVSNVLKSLLDRNMKGVPVVDDEKKVVGLFERWKVLDKLAERKFKEGVWLHFSGFPLKIETIELIKDYLKSDIRKMKQICPDLESINIHIKKIHGATPEKWNYEIKVHLLKSAGRGEVVTSKEPWYGYNLMFTLQDAFNRLLTQLQKKYKKREGKNYYAVKRGGAIRGRGKPPKR